MRVKTEFQIYEKKHRSGRISYVVNGGKMNGKRHLPPLGTRDRDIVKLLKVGESVRNAAKISGKGNSTVRRVKAAIAA